MRFSTGWLLLGLLAACGGRSALEADDGLATSSSTGGSGGTAGSGGTGAAGGGVGGQGAQAPCVQGVQGPRSFDLPNGELGRRATLVASSSDGERVSLLTVAGQVPPPIDGSPTLRQVTFDDPWTNWTETTLGSPLSVTPALDFRAPHGPGNGLTLWVSAATQATGPQVLYVEEADPLVENPPASVLLGFNPPLSHVTQPRLGSASVGYVQTSQTVIGLASPGLLLPIDTQICASPPPFNGVSDAVAVDDHFLLATPQPMFPGCDLPFEVLLWRHDPGGLPNLLTVFAVGPVSHAFMRPRPGGAWLFIGVFANATQPLQAIPLDENGNVVGAPFTVQLPPLFEPSTLTVSEYGDGFAWAMLTTDSGEVGAIQVQAYDAAGNPTEDWALTPNAAPRTDEPLSLLPSPDGDALLLAWSSDAPDPGTAGNSRVFAARLGCE